MDLDIQVHARGHLLSAVSWISKDHLLKSSIYDNNRATCLSHNLWFHLVLVLHSQNHHLFGLLLSKQVYMNMIVTMKSIHFQIIHFQQCKLLVKKVLSYHSTTTSPCSAVVSAWDRWLMVMGWNPISFRILQPWPASTVLVLTRAESSMASVIRLGPHSSASSTLQIVHPWGCCSNYLTNTVGAAVPRPV